MRKGDFMRRLTDDVGVDELRRMRENGMTNADIAQALGTTAVTVRRYIGPQPGRNWGGVSGAGRAARRGGRSPRGRGPARLPGGDQQRGLFAGRRGGIRRGRRETAGELHAAGHGDVRLCGF